MTQQQPPTQLAQTFPVKTEGLTTASILTTSNAPVNLPAIGLPSSAPVQSTTSASIPSTSAPAVNATNKNDPKVVEQSVAKLKQFLKNLVKLAEGRKKEVQDQVQSHVQRLLAGALSEEQFAENLEKDLNSPHQPNLLPFLKSSVPHLRATLLQQRLMIDKQQQLLEKQKIAALLMTQASAAGLNNTKPANQAAAIVATAAAALTTTPAATAPTTTTALLATPNTSINTSQAPNWTAQNLKFLQNMTPEKQQQLLQQRQVLQQYLEMQQAQLKKEALEAVNSINATSEPDIQITGVSRQQAKNITSQSPNLPNQFLKSTPTSNSNLLSRSSSPFALNKSISNGSTAPFGSANSSPSGKFLDSKFKAKPLTRGKTKKDFSTFGDGHSDDEEEDMEVAGVNLQEEAVHFLPPSAIEADTSGKKIEDVLILDKELLRHKILAKGRLHDVTSTTDDTISLVSHATEERLKNILSKLAVISQHRTDILKDDAHYELKSQPRDQLKLLESIDRVHTKRKQEQEREKLLKAAKSKSKSDDPNLIRIKEQAKQLQMEEEEQIRKRAANETALSAIGTRRKRPAPNSQEAQLSSATGSSLGVLTGSQPKHKRRVGLRDLVFMMEQEREMRKSTLFYKTLMK
ncbi:transcription initiation factor TFIID subunit 4B-like isoform X2 [Dysidea avara]|uniref:transcription initiation factor TFIID subunit 4B-like isoform X2 n=1 Tax=Dysidea avara TaxID=196820 RepID=UPI00332E6746